MTRQTFDTVDALRLEVEDPTPEGLVNQVKNPDGRLGSYGWHETSGYAPAAVRRGSAVVSGQTVDVLSIGPASGGTPLGLSADTSGLASVEPGEWVATTYIAGGPAGWNQGFILWLDADGFIGSSAGTIYAQSATTTRTLGPFEAPTGAVYAQVQVFTFSTSGGALATAGQTMSLRNVTTAKAATALELAGLGYIDPVQFRDIVGGSTTVTIEREGLSVGVLNATIVDPALDPSEEDTIRPGHRVRCLALNDDTAEWDELFVGKVSKGSVVYRPARPGQRAQITLEAVDNVSVLAQVGQPNGVATIDELPYLLAQTAAGISWNVNGSTGEQTTATVVATNDAASLIDQVAITRDTVLGFAWVDRHGVLQVWDRDEITATPVADLTDADYNGDASITFDTEDLINEVSVVFRRINAATGETVEVAYGPYRNDDSIVEWGARKAEFTIQGAVDDPSDIEAYAQLILDANATPTVRANSLTLPVRTAADIVPGRAFLDLYDLVDVTKPGAVTAEPARVTSVRHVITSEPAKWMVTLGFAAPDSVASPQVTAALTNTPQAPPANTVYVGDVAIVYGTVDLTSAALSPGTTYWQSGVDTEFPAGVFANAPRVVLTSRGTTIVPITFSTKVVTADGFSWRSYWDDETAHTGPGAADFIAIGPRA